MVFVVSVGNGWFEIKLPKGNNGKKDIEKTIWIGLERIMTTQTTRKEKK